MACKKIYRSQEVLDIELGGYKIILTLMDLFVNAISTPEKSVFPDSY